MGVAKRSMNVWGVVVAAVVMTAGLAPMLAVAADQDPLQDVCVADVNSNVVLNGFPCKPLDQVQASDFKSQALVNPGDTNNPFLATVTPAFVAQFPGLNTQGIGAARIDFAKGGINPPHTHPRATELLLVIKGELYVGFVTTENVLFASTVKSGELFVFPRGLVHFQLNVGKSPALAFAALNSQNPGAQVIAQSLFNSTPPIQNEVLQKGFLIDEKTVEWIRENFQK